MKCSKRINRKKRTHWLIRNNRAKGETVAFKMVVITFTSRPERIMNELCSCVKVDAHVVGRRVVGFDAQIRDSHSGVIVIASPGAVSTVQHVSEGLPAKCGAIFCEIPVEGGVC